MKKEFWFTLCGGVLLMALFFAPQTGGSVMAANPFVDVRDGDWHAPYILDLVERGIVNGRTKTSFQPNGKVTREEFAKMLAEASGADLKAYTGISPFNDVAKNRWSARHIAWASQMGIVEGVGGGRFNPQACITRQEIAAMIARYGEKASKAPLPQLFAAVDFRDRDRIASWARDSVGEIQRAGILCGYINRTFVPLADASRAEAAKILASLLWITEKGYVPPETVYRDPALDEDGPSPKAYYEIFEKQVNGHTVAGVLIDPATVNTNVALADHFDISAHAPLSSFVTRHSAKVLVNGGYFDSSPLSAGHNPYFTLVRNGEVMYIRNQATVLSIDENGVPDIGPLRIRLKIQREEGDAVETSYINIGTSKEYDVLEIFTSRWGESLGFAAKKAVAVNAAAEIVAIAGEEDMEIPAEGFVLCGDHEVLETLAVGDRLTWTPQYTNGGGGQIRAALGAGPILVKDGVPGYDYAGEGFTTLPKGPAIRSAVGVRADGMMVVIVTRTEVALADLPGLMKTLGCVDAMNLDGGASSGLYAGGSYLLTSVRKVNNVLYFK